MRALADYTIAYKDLYDRYVIVYNMKTDTYSRYNVTAKGKYVLVSTGSTMDEVNHVG